MAVALKEGRPIRNAEAVAERPDGTRVPFIPYCTPLRDSRGRVVGAINMLVDISQRKQAETQQRLLFNELNHRVKNNMQMLQSVLFMGAQRTRSPEAQQVLNEASGRMAAMTAAQQTLYATAGATRFRAQEFLGAVCQTIQQTFPPDVTVETEVAEGELPYDAAMPLALILNELLTNAVKHGLHSQKGTIRVGLKQSPTGFVLYVQDNGKGFNLSSVRGRSSGLQLVQGLARQLRGGLDVQVENGTRCVVEFSL
jgi:two-component sensor histidine kinase